MQPHVLPVAGENLSEHQVFERQVEQRIALLEEDLYARRRRPDAGKRQPQDEQGNGDDQATQRAGDLAFCAGGDQKVRGDAGGYKDEQGVQHLNVLDLQRQIRSLPKPVVAMVAGYAIGGGQVLQLICDLTIAADNARFGQTGPKVGSFDGGLGAGLLARTVGLKKAKEI
nr:hypothetical protein [Anaerolineae bacterium]